MSSTDQVATGITCHITGNACTKLANLGNRRQRAVGSVALYQHQQAHLYAKSLAFGTAIVNAGFIDSTKL